MVEAGHSRRAIQRQLGMTGRTVKRYADAAKPEDLFAGQWRTRTSVLDEHETYLDGRRNEGRTSAWKLREGMVPLGCQGSYQRVRAYLYQRRISPRPVAASPPSSRTVAGWVLGRPEDLSGTEHLPLTNARANCPEIDARTRHVRSFATMLTERLPDWLAAARQDNLPSLHILAAGIRRDRGPAGTATRPRGLESSP
ncbi:hypothetical protein [Streptomyces sp. NPDC056796]|uniref:hypothetical protein n=1 Tax=Streptomyces sp. NPDC056796 TaxID=3345947 RepID=UPI0036C01868